MRKIVFIIYTLIVISTLIVVSLGIENLEPKYRILEYFKYEIRNYIIARWVLFEFTFFIRELFREQQLVGNIVSFNYKLYNKYVSEKKKTLNLEKVNVKGSGMWW